jgi:hypothetical protein
MSIRIQCMCVDSAHPGQGDVGWVTMTDPDRNEFDVLRPLPVETELAA